MDIQQTDKESLAAYVHLFKWEASRCKFNNDAATIRIFLKGLKNAHTLATKVYEKGPQSLSDTIKEIEKLQVAQQITSTLIPTSLVNTMSSDNDKCFQCQETGHMVCYCPHIRCFDCKNYNMLLQIALIKYHLQAHQHATETTPPVDMTDHHLGTIATPGVPTVIIGTDTGSVVLDPTHITLDTGVTATMTPIRVTPDHFIDHSSSHNRSSSSYYYHCYTPHHRSSSCRNFSPDEVDPECINPASTTTNLHTDHLPVHSPHPGCLTTEGTNELPLMIHPWSITAPMSKTVIQRMI